MFSEFQKLTNGFFDATDRLQKNYKIPVIHRGVMETHRAELKAEILRFSKGIKLTACMHNKLESENFHFLIEILKEIEKENKATSKSPKSWPRTDATASAA